MTDSIVTIAETMEQYIQSRNDEFGFRKIWYGDDQLIPETPAINIVPLTKRRTLNATGHTTENALELNIVIFHSRLDKPSVTRKECDVLAERLEAVLHENKRLDGNVIYGYVRELEPGVATRNNVMMRATRLLWTSLTKTRI